MTTPSIRDHTGRLRPLTPAEVRDAERKAAAELDALAALRRARRELSRARLELGRAHGPADGMTAWADSMVEQVDLLIRQCER